MAASANGRLFHVESASKVYPAKVALASVSLTIHAGERVALVGPSGSGKTTLLHLLAGVIQPTEGRIALNGHFLSDVKPGRELSSLVGVIHQQFDLVPHLSVLQNVLAGRLGQWGLLKSVVSLLSPRDRHIAERALQRVGLSDKMRERASRLSGGEQQRVAIARLLVQDPRVIIADEPVSSLDPARAKDIAALLASIAIESNKTLIASIHAVELARANFNRVIGLRNGRIAFDLPVSDLSDDTLNALYELDGLEDER
ncbi:MAG: ATP-binding cassette domain-containing protein [Chloroflexi bacterium]|nr:ATP-binding cassette domain-containing protein [Chloroflexota bacterium]